MSDEDHNDEERFAEPADSVKRRNVITGLIILAIILTIMTISIITRVTAS